MSSNKWKPRGFSIKQSARSMFCLFLVVVFGSIDFHFALEVHVGPSQTYSTISDAFAAIEGNSPPHTLYVHYQPTPYFEKFAIPSSQFSLIGVPDENGNLPILDGAGATVANDQEALNEVRGLVKIGQCYPPHCESVCPEDVTISHLHLRNAHQSQTFTGNYDAPGLSSYDHNAACIYLSCGKRVVISNNEVELCGNGIFSGINDGQTQDVTIRGNYIHDNGYPGRWLEHNSYCSADRITYEYNLYGPLVSGCEGTALKDRSIDAVIRYNYIIDGNRQLDLVDCPTCPDTVLGGARDPYDRVYVYGNVLEERNPVGNAQMVHFGGDQADQNNFRNGPLYVHYNTFISRLPGRTTLISLSRDVTAADFRNNIIYYTGSELDLLAGDQGILQMEGNCIRQGYYDSGVTISDTTETTSIEGLFYDFDQFDYHLNESSPCRNKAISLAAGASSHMPTLQFFEQMPPAFPASSHDRDGTDDLGAFEYDANYVPGEPPGGGSGFNTALAVGVSVGVVSALVLVLVIVGVIVVVVVMRKKNGEGQKMKNKKSAKLKKTRR